MYYNDLLPVDHPECARDCMEVVRILMRQPKTEGNFRLMDAALARAREAHSLSPTTNEDRQDRIDACSLLAVSLERRADYEDDVSLLNQVISLQREALALCPAGQMHTTLYNRLLAGSLKRMHKRTGEDHSLEEAILLEREALSFCPSEHPEHPGACGDLASSLIVRYEKSGSDHLLQEAIGLQREALSICLLDNPYRPWGCGSLAGSLAMRYDRTGDDRLLDEAIELQREALVLCEVEHPYRAASCGNLADSLVSRYKQNEDDSLLEEAIFLLREGLALRPEGHPRRALACGNLANALKTRYQRTHDDRLLDEVINLEREALALGPEARSDRAMFLSNLTASLVLRLVRTRDITLFTEIYTLEEEGIAIASPPARWRNLCKLSWVHFTPTSPFYDVEKAISYLSQSFDDGFDNMSQALGEIAACIGRIWDLDAENKYTRLTSIYERTIKLLPLLSHSALELHPKLNALREFSQIGSDAFVSAALAGDPTLGLEILELARGVIWSQSLYLRDPQLQDVPEPFQTELKELLHEVMTRSVKNERPSAFTSRDLLHDQSSRANNFVREIREMQGLDRFMLGETFETLRTVASHHPVVLLVGARRHFYALILTALHYKILSLELSDEDLRSLSFTLGSAQLQRSVEQPGDALPEIERLGLKKVTPSGTVAPLDLQSRTLWRKVVSPILEQLGLKVSNSLAAALNAQTR
jgi:tetratricopeptide (TPR) repeat protein